MKILIGLILMATYAKGFDQLNNITIKKLNILDQCEHKNELAQLLIIGLPSSKGKTPNTYLTDLKKFQQYLAKYQFGGVISFTNQLSIFKTPKQLANAINQMQGTLPNQVPRRALKKGLFITIDQEGGLVQRLKNYQGVTYIPSAKLVGAYLDHIKKIRGEDAALSIAYTLGKHMGRELFQLGFNWNFAPVTDIDLNPINAIIGKYGRAYGKKVLEVSSYSAEIIKGMQSMFVMATAKHFPGHGRSGKDSHKGSAIIPVDLDTLRQVELIPFQAAIEANVASTMIGHLLVPKVDPVYPATFSETIVQKLLIEELNFDGLIISDDFTMGAIPAFYGKNIKKYRDGDDMPTYKKAVLQAIKAGVNTLILSPFRKGRRELHALEAMCEAYQKDPLIKERLDLSMKKVALQKEMINISTPPLIDLKTNDLKTRESMTITKNIIEFAIQKFGLSKVKTWEKTDIDWILNNY